MPDLSFGFKHAKLAYLEDGELLMMDIPPFRWPALSSTAIALYVVDGATLSGAVTWLETSSFSNKVRHSIQRRLQRQLKRRNRDVTNL